MPKVTIRDVAKEAGVSISAVSYILNNSKDKKYAEATVKAVHAAAEKLHYVPNRIARGMRTGSIGSIGVVLSRECTGTVVGEAYYALAEAAGKLGCSLSLLPLTEGAAYVDAYHARSVDGFIVFSPPASAFFERAHIRALKEADVPFVIVGGTQRQNGVATVQYDFYAASRLGVSYLLEKGCTRVAYLDAYAEAPGELRERKEGYIDEIRDAGLLPRLYEAERLTAEDLLGVDAFLTSSAEAARLLVQRLLDAGVREKDMPKIVAGSAGKNAAIPLNLPFITFDFSAAAIYAIDAARGKEAPRTFVAVPQIEE